MAWGLSPLFFAAAAMDLAQIGTLAALYPATWGIAQLLTGAWSDRVGRKWLIASGMWVQAIGIAVTVLADGYAGFASGAVLLGLGTAMVYPTLLAAIGDVAHPTWRASAVGVYRLWRDLGYAFGALLAGSIADAFGLPAAIWLVAALTFGSGIVVAVRMRETLRPTASPNSPCIEAAELRQLTGAVVVDVRSPDEYAQGHVDSAINIPLDTLGTRIAELPRATVIVTVCAHGGGRSEQAAAQLRAAGYHGARSLCGGTHGWHPSYAAGA